MLIEATSEIASRITGAIRDAAKAAGASFDYLLKTALRESNLNPEAKAATSSATGLFQFIDQTWLGTLKRAVPALGYSNYADAIARTPSGRFVVPNPAQRRAVMGLRNDPAAASAMAGAFTEHNAALLTERLGRKPSDGELYMAHFLGPSGAVKLISATRSNPNTKAHTLFPHAARANRSIFYGNGGAARNVGQVYAALAAKHDTVRTPTAVAAAAVSAPPAPPSMPIPTPRSNPFAAAPIEPARASAAERPPDPVAVSAFATEPSPVFHGLFRTGREPVAAVVSEIWGVKPLPAAGAHTARVAQGHDIAAAPAKAPGRQGPLFEFLRPDIRPKGGRGA